VETPLEEENEPKDTQSDRALKAFTTNLNEQPALKGTLPVTVIEPKEEKKKLSKQEKSDAFNALGKDIEKLKAQLFHETRKGKKAELMRALSKANRQLKKLM
jgi:diadenosine tetraphosphate (Ap4A) HIT family hydrolase